MKKIILCPNPSPDRGMEATRTADAILREMGFHTVVCSPFRDQREELLAGYHPQALPQELKTGDLLLTVGGEGTILHLAKLAALLQQCSRPDQNEQLLLALRPHFSPQRAGRIVDAIRIMQLCRLWPALRESGLLGELGSLLKGGGRG